MEYRYKAIDENNNTVEGVSAAKNKFELASFLKKQGLILTEAEESKKKSFFSFQKILEIGTVTTQERISFARNVSAMIEAGLSLSRALHVIEKQSKNKRFKKIIREINTKVKEGASLSDTLGAYPKIFNNLFVSMVRAGEESGNIVSALAEVSEQMDKTYKLKKKIKGAMIYPGVIISAMVIVGIFMMIYIVPTLTSTFEEIGADLPASTQFIINLSKFFNENLMLGLLIILVIGALLFLAGKSKSGKKAFSFILLNSPMISNLAKETYSARTSRTLASLLKAGVPYLKAVQITKATITNVFYLKVLDKVEKQVEMGLPVSTVFEENSKLYPPFVSEMIAVGEETGELSGMLFKVASYYENEIEQKTKNISTIVEPVLMIIVGVAVGFFAISMISPMYSLVEEF
jgi:type IV pilus assembly protein PilC